MLRLTAMMALASSSLAAQAPAAMQTAIDQMRAADAHKAAPGQIQLNLQSPACNCDVSPQPLFASVDPSLLSYDVYSAYKAIWALMHPDVNTPETYSPKDPAIQKFITLIQATPVYKIFLPYMKSQGQLTGVAAADRLILATMWFGRYSRAKDGKTKGSSGFEHVFVGEEKPESSCKGCGSRKCGCTGIVDGQHYWARWYAMEQAGRLNYYGSYSLQGTASAPLQFTGQYMWDSGFIKRIGGGLVGTSVEFDFCLFTMAWFNNHNGLTEFTIDGHKLGVQAYQETGTTYVATTYPIDVNNSPVCSCPTTTKGPTSPPPSPQSHGTAAPGLQAVVDYLASQDSIHYKSQISLKFGNMCSKKCSKIYDHNTNGRFFSSVQSSILSSDVYNKFNAVLGIFNPNVSVAETWSSQNVATINAFLTAVTATPSWTFLTNYLRQHNLVSQSQSMVDTLRGLWFRQFSRSAQGGGIASTTGTGSSAFESVFGGEQYFGTDDCPRLRSLGLHSWARFYALEQAGRANYFGWLSRDLASKGGAFVDIQLAWDGGHVEVEDSFFMGTSVEMDLALYTLCALAAPGYGQCQFNYKGASYGINTKFNAGGLFNNAYPHM